MSDLLARLRAAIDEVERIANACGATDWRIPFDGSIVDRDTDGWKEATDESVIFSYGGRDRSAEADHAVTNDPDAVLRMVAAHRKLLTHAEAHCRKYDERVECGDAGSIEHGAAMYEVIYQLALAYGIEP